MAEGLTGSLAQLPLADLLKMLAAGGQSGRLQIAAGAGHGELYLAQGEVVHADCDMRTGEAAFARLVGWPNGQFRFEPGVSAPERTIEKPLDRLLAESARAASEREAIRRVIPNMEAVPQLARKSPGPTVTIDGRDWELLALIDGNRTAADLAVAVGAEDIDMAKALYRLKVAGLVELAAVQAAVPQPRALAGPAFFQSLNAAVAGALGPLAEIIIDDAVEDLGFTRATLPRDAVAALAERISGEIREPDKRVKFQQTMLQMLRGNPQAA